MCSPSTIEDTSTRLAFRAVLSTCGEGSTRKSQARGVFRYHGFHRPNRCCVRTHLECNRVGQLDDSGGAIVYHGAQRERQQKWSRMIERSTPCPRLDCARELKDGGRADEPHERHGCHIILSLDHLPHKAQHRKGGLARWCPMGGLIQLRACLDTSTCMFGPYLCPVLLLVRAAHPSPLLVSRHIQAPWDALACHRRSATGCP